MFVLILLILSIKSIEIKILLILIKSEGSNEIVEFEVIRLVSIKVVSSWIVSNNFIVVSENWWWFWIKF